MTLGFATLALGIASAASYSLKLTDPAWVGNTQLKPGEYKVEMHGGEAVFTSAQQTIEAPAVEEKADKKFRDTSLNPWIPRFARSIWAAPIPPSS